MKNFNLKNFNLHRDLTYTVAILSVFAITLWFGLPAKELAEDPANCINCSAFENLSFSILYICYAVLAIALGFVLFHAFKGISSDRKTLDNTLKGVGAFLILFTICYLISSGEETTLKDGKVLEAWVSKLIGAALYMFYLLIIVAAGSMLYFGGKKQ